MILFSLRKTGFKKAAAIALLLLVLVSVCAFMACASREPVKSTATADEVGSYSTKAESIADIERFLAVFDIEIEAESEEADNARIPVDFNKAYTDYNKLQKKIGLDLAPFKGKSVKRLTYKTKSKEKQVTLLVFKKHIIGGHICSGVYGEDYKDLLSEKYGKTG